VLLLSGSAGLTISRSRSAKMASIGSPAMGRVGRQLLQEIAWLDLGPTGRSAMRLAGTHPRALLSDALA
jgi:hypothetical protein